MSPAEIYPSSRIKRQRATKSEMATRRRRIYQIVERDQPMTVRQVYYQAVVHGIVGKAEEDYDKVQDMLTELRRDGEIPYEWIIDEGRFARQPYTVEGIPQALNDTRRNYRKDPWQGIDEYVQIWVEKNALVGVLEPVTSEYDVALMAAVGYSSISFLHEAAQRLIDLGHPIYIYHLGDLDPSGAQAAEAIEKDLRGFAPDADIHFRADRHHTRTDRRFRTPGGVATDETEGSALSLVPRQVSGHCCPSGWSPIMRAGRDPSYRPARYGSQGHRAASVAQRTRHSQRPWRAGEDQDRRDTRPLPRRAARSRADLGLPQWRAR